MYSSAYRKVARAQQHMDEFDDEIRKFVAEGCHTVFVDRDMDGTELIKVETKSIPDAMSLILGDAIHNLRSALDIGFWHLAESKGFGDMNQKQVMFPFGQTVGRFEDAMDSRKVHSLGADVSDVFINQIQPYAGGNRTLWAIHALDIVDKHKLILTVGGVSSVVNICAEGAYNCSMSGQTVMVQAGHGLRPVAGFRNTRITNQGKAFVDIFINEPEILDDPVSVANWMPQAFEDVKSCLEMFVRLN